MSTEVPKMAAKQLTLFECQSETGNPPKRRKTDTSSAQKNGKTLQENSIVVENPTGSTTIVINDRPMLSLASGSTSSDFGQGLPSDIHSEPVKSKTADGVPSDIAAGPDQSPVQPKMKFPSKWMGDKYRHFHSEWYQLYKWLEYSQEKDAAYCYPCRLFTSEHSRQWETFTRNGFNDWKHALGKDGIISGHDQCKIHKGAMVAWQQYVNNKAKGTSIADRLNEARSQLVTNNRHYLRTILEVLLLCSQQEIALRGHDESVKSLNRGNFIEILKLISIHDEVVKDRILCGPKNAVYTSPVIQNELLQIMSDMVQSFICSKIQEAGSFSILVDESKDCSKKEQLTLVLRCIDPEEAATHEYFLTFVEATSLDAEGLTKYIVDTLNKHQLDLTCIVSQGYDGASVMSGHCTGVQTRLKEFAPHAVYIHCHAHILNLVLVDSVKAIPEATQFFALLESLYVFMSTTKAHAVFLQKQRDLHPEKQTRELKRLSDTRWACRHAAVNSICYTFDAILETLGEIAEDSDGIKSTQANGLRLQVKSFKFILCLIIFDKVLSITKGLSDVLQSTSLDLAKAADLVAGTIETLEDLRTDSYWESLFSYAESVARVHGIDVTGPCSSRRRRPPSHLNDVILLESTGAHEPLTTNEGFKVGLFFPILDAFLMELNQRFTEKNVELMKAIRACSPQCDHFLEPVHLKPLIDNYKLDCESLEMESTLAKRTLASKKMENTVDVFKELSPLKEAFPTLLRLLQIALTICVSSASCERSFSALKRIKTYLRSTMLEERLVSLAVLSIEREIAQNLNLEDVIDRFCTKDKNRRIQLS